MWLSCCSIPFLHSRADTRVPGSNTDWFLFCQISLSVATWSWIFSLELIMSGMELCPTLAPQFLHQYQSNNTSFVKHKKAIKIIIKLLEIVSFVMIFHSSKVFCPLLPLLIKYSGFTPGWYWHKHPICGDNSEKKNAIRTKCYSRFIDISSLRISITFIGGQFVWQTHF